MRAGSPTTYRADPRGSTAWRRVNFGNARAQEVSEKVARSRCQALDVLTARRTVIPERDSGLRVFRARGATCWVSLEGAVIVVVAEANHGAGRGEDTPVACRPGRQCRVLGRRSSGHGFADLDVFGRSGSTRSNDDDLDEAAVALVRMERTATRSSSGRLPLVAMTAETAGLRGEVHRGLSPYSAGVDGLTYLRRIDTESWRRWRATTGRTTTKSGPKPRKDVNPAEGSGVHVRLMKERRGPPVGDGGLAVVRNCSTESGS